MKSDDDSNLFSADTNGTDITTDITKSDDGKKKRRKASKRKRKSNVHRDRHSVMQFIYSWSDDMFRPRFRVARE
jgi:hypothetical protein